MSPMRWKAVLRVCLAAGGLAAAAGATASDTSALQGLATHQLIRAGMDRATRTPLEIVWLRQEVLAQLWRDHPALAQRSGDCSRAGAPRQGCTLGSPPAQRYQFGAETYADGRVGALGRAMYAIVPKAGIPGLTRTPDGDLLLAAGASVQLVDAAYPELGVELRAPKDRALPLGNLVSADIGRAVALLARQPGVENASAASIGAAGQIAFRAGNAPRAEPVMMAAIAPAPRVLPVVEAARPAPAAIATNGEGSAPDVAAYAPTPAAPKPEWVIVAAIAQDLDAERTIRSPLRSGGEGGSFVSYAPAPPKHEPILANAPVVVAAAIVSPDFERGQDAGDRLNANGEGSGIDVVAWSVPVAAAPARSEPARAALPDVARMRAEIEAEIERERTRLAATLRPATAPKRFAFSSGA